MASNFVKLRRISSTTAADPSWHTLQRPIGPLVSVATVDTNAAHSFDINPSSGPTVTITATAATEAGVADGWAAFAATLLSTTLANLVTAVDSDGVDRIYITPLHENGQQATPFVIDNFVEPGTAVIATAPAGEFPITAIMPHGEKQGVKVAFRLVDGSDVRVPDNVTVADIEVLVNDTDKDLVQRIARFPGHRLIDPLPADVPPGAKFSVRLASPVGSPPAAPFDAMIAEWSPA